MEKVINTVKSMLGMEVSNDSVNAKLFDSGRAIPAKSAYMHSKYGINKTQSSLLREFFVNANELIASKSNRNEYCCMLPVDNDIKKFIPHIVKRYRDELGYEVIVLDKNTKITTTDNKTVSLNKEISFIILMWDCADISEEVLPDVPEDNNKTA